MYFIYRAPTCTSTSRNGDSVKKRALRSNTGFLKTRIWTKKSWRIKKCEVWNEKTVILSLSSSFKKSRKFCNFFRFDLNFCNCYKVQRKLWRKPTKKIDSRFFTTTLWDSFIKDQFISSFSLFSLALNLWVSIPKPDQSLCFPLNTPKYTSSKNKFS